ncbi:MAG: hypothetical protein O7C75_05990 [Verrucomicrobia bacterium]|nr:hypothetical protein [Verrucomicrobiota bacterium]
MRDNILTIWERYVKPRAAANPDHQDYYFCFDDEDADTVCVFQLFTHDATFKRFLAGDWYPGYLKEIAEVVVDAPQIQSPSLVWQKDSISTQPAFLTGEMKP